MLRRFVVVATLAACTSTGGLTGGGDTDAGVDAAPSTDAAVSDADVETSIDANVEAAAATPYRDAVLADSPLAYYRFEETIGAVAANEVAAAGGIPAATYQSVTLGRPGALASEPKTHAIETAAGRVFVDDARLAFAGKSAYTLEAWVQPKTIDGQYRRILSREQSSTPRNGYLVHVQSAAVGFERFSDGAFDNSDYAGTLVLGSWTHVVATFDGTTMLLYINASLAASSSGPVNSTAVAPTESFTIGADSQSGSANFVGLIDEVAVYDKALSAARVAAHYSAAMEK